MSLVFGNRRIGRARRIRWRVPAVLCGG